jgi:hypothetical protein
MQQPWISDFENPSGRISIFPRRRGSSCARYDNLRDVHAPRGGNLDCQCVRPLRGCDVRLLVERQHDVFSLRTTAPANAPDKICNSLERIDSHQYRIPCSDRRPGWASPYLVVQTTHRSDTWDCQLHLIPPLGLSFETLKDRFWRSGACRGNTDLIFAWFNLASPQCGEPQPLSA